MLEQKGAVPVVLGCWRNVPSKITAKLEFNLSTRYKVVVVVIAVIIIIII